MLKSLNPTRICLVLIGCYLLMLATMFGRDGGWLVESDGLKREVEFAGVRAAGDLVSAGKPAAAYDWIEHRRAQDAVIGQPSVVYFPWPYPPPYLAVAGLVAQLPYIPAAITFIVVTVALFAWSAATIAGRWQAAIWALATPATYINASVAHTGFLLAGLLGLGLAWLPAYPVAAGIAFGLLGFKPQLGLLIPLALAAGGHWRTFWAAAGTVLIMYAASALAYGIEPWLEFQLQLGKIADTIRDGQINMARLVSFYGLARLLGAGHVAAITIHAAAALVPVVAVFRLWRSRAPFELKAAGLAAASLLVTPYLFFYDMTLLSIAVIFLVRLAGPAGLDPIEIATLLGAGVLLLLFSILPIPVGLVGNVAIAALVVRRWRLLVPNHSMLDVWWPRALTAGTR